MTAHLYFVISFSARENGNTVDDETSLCLTHSSMKPVAVILSIVKVQIYPKYFHPEDLKPSFSQPNKIAKSSHSMRFGCRRKNSHVPRNRSEGSEV